MKDGFIKVATASPLIRLADCNENLENIKRIVLKAEALGVKLLAFPELCITGATCGDLFFSERLVASAKDSLLELAEFTKEKNVITVVGLPLRYKTKLFNCAAVLCGGEVAGIIPKTHIPSWQKRYFESGATIGECSSISINDLYYTDFDSDIIFTCNELCEFSFGVEIGEDLFAAMPRNQKLALSGANIIVNPSAIMHTVETEKRCQRAIEDCSARLNCGYILSNCGNGESTGDGAFSGLSFICENGKVLEKSTPFGDDELLISEIDVKYISSERCKNSLISMDEEIKKIEFSMDITETELTRYVEKSPFMPLGTDCKERCKAILEIQANALAHRLSHTYSKCAVIGISGGLDSTLALLVAVRSMRLLGRPMTDILAITIPCFGTTKRTRSNSELLCEALGVSFKEINITASVRQHFADIGQCETELDVTYENSQARERTQVLMDIANKEGGIVIGTGDLSELALGWATYNGDHMSMYGVNAGVPKTLIRHIVQYEADNSAEALKNVLFDILDTPVSPELLPADSKGDIAQKTEDLVGPYELHDFFLYHTVRYGETPSKIYRLAKIAFPEYSKETLIHWLNTFTIRFFNQQFKRSCLPDGPKIGSVGLSPRGDWHMPSDAVSRIWLNEIEEIKNS